MASVVAKRKGFDQKTDVGAVYDEPMPSAFPALRADLEILPSPTRSGPTNGFLIKDPLSQQVFEMEKEEYFLCQQLDGQTSLDTIHTRFENHFAISVSYAEIEAFVRQLDFQGLLENTVTEGMFHYREAEEQLIPIRQYPLFNPHRLLSWLSIRLWWWFTRPFVIATSTLIAIGVWLLISRWSDLTNILHIMWQPTHWPLLIIVGILCVQVSHELVHGLVSTHYGGHVTEAGCMTFYYVIPKFYVSRRQTIALPTREKAKLYWVFFAGLYCQFLLASIGIIGVLLAAPHSYAHFFFGALWSTAAMGAVHNGNIAHRRDAHFLLAMWLGIVEMRKRTIEVLMNWILRRPEPEPLTPRERFGFRLFGLLTIAYYFFHANVMIWTFGEEVTRSFQGTGLFLWAGVLLFIAHRPLLRYLRAPVHWLTASKANNFTRRLTRVVWLAIVIGILLLPYPYETGGVFKVLPLKQTQIHAEVEGRILEVFVKENHWVQPGQPLAEIEPREYEKNLKTTQEQLAVAEAQLRLLQAGPKPEEVQKAEQEVKKAEQDVREAEVRLGFSHSKAERYAALYKEEAVSQQDYENAVRERDVNREELGARKKTLDVAKAHLALVKSGSRPEEIEAKEAEIRRLQTLVADYEEELRLTVITSPVEGQIITPYIDQKSGQYLEKGDLFGIVVDSRSVQIEVLVPEEESPQVQQGARLRVVAWAFPDKTFMGTVMSVAPIAQKTDGGITTVRVLAEIPNADNLLKADMTGYAKSSTEGKPVWDVLLRRIIRWFQVEFWYWLP